MHNYVHVFIYTYIYTHIQTYIFIGKSMIMLVNVKCYSIPTTLIKCWYYVIAVPTTLVLRQSGSYYVFTRSLPRPLTATLILRIF